MNLSIQTSNILNSTKWQLLKTSEDSAYSLLTYLSNAYAELTPTTQSVLNIYISLNNLRNNNVTISQLCEWVELNQGQRIKNKKDFTYIVHTIALIA